MAGKRKVLVLTSGGLDSLLVLKIMQQNGLEVAGIRFRTWFTIPRFEPLDEYAPESVLFGIPVFTADVSEEFTPVLMNPRYGYGKASNPCIDCKIFFLQKAREHMAKIGADFVATGEVMGQRPMTQNPNSLKLIEKKSGLEGYLLRPLSAKLLPVTVPEELGWVDREKLYGISGRGRKDQINLAAKLGVTEYPSPAGGCHLTDGELHRRLAAMTGLEKTLTVNDFYILRYGRHFLIQGDQKLVVGRNERENDLLRRTRWGNVLIDATAVPGPLSLMEWNGRMSGMRQALSTVARYCDQPRGGGLLRVVIHRGDKVKTLRVPFPGERRPPTDPVTAEKK